MSLIPTQAEGPPGKIVRKFTQPFMVHPRISEDRVRVHVHARPLGFAQQILRVSQVPPDIGIGQPLARQGENGSGHQGRQRRWKREDACGERRLGRRESR